jgi:hypothetical protein
MIPIFLLGSAVYLVCLFHLESLIHLTCPCAQGLQLTQQKLSHEKYMEEASQHVRALEAEVEAFQVERMRDETSVQISPNKRSRWWW